MKTHLLILAWLIPLTASANTYLTVTGAGVKRAKLAIGQVHPPPDNTTPDPALARKIREQVVSDLEFENIFELQKVA